LDYRRVAEKLLLASRQLAGIRYYVGEISGDLARFWRTLNEDIVEYSLFDSVEQFQIQLEQYLLYYNEHRPHQSFNPTPTESPQKPKPSSSPSPPPTWNRNPTGFAASMLRIPLCIEVNARGGASPAVL